MFPQVKSSTLTGLAACLFGTGVFLLFLVLYQGTSRTGLIFGLALVLLAATLGCWAAAARKADASGIER